MIPIFDNGHGGLINGVYQTAGKRSPDWNRGVLYEGVFNRKIVRRVINLLKQNNMPYGYVSDTEIDVPLHVRVSKANYLYESFGKKAYLFSVHANAGGGTGWEIFTSFGQTKSDKVAGVFIKHFLKLPLRHRADWSDGDGDKEANFYVLTRTKCPAVLMEYGFMDNPKDYAYLQDKAFEDIAVELTFNAIMELYNVEL